MFKKTKVKQIINLILHNANNSFIANSLDVSRNSVIKIRNKIEELNLSNEDLLGKEDNELYEIFFSNKFKRKSSSDIKFLYELFDLRSEINSTIFISQFDKSTWHDRFGGGVHADSIMDRISHNAYKIPSATNNIRKHIDNEKVINFIEDIESK